MHRRTRAPRGPRGWLDRDGRRRCDRSRLSLALLDRRLDLLGFLLSFTVIARLWLAQHHIVRGLVRQNRLVVQLRFSEDLSQSEIARRVGLSQMHVSRLLGRAVGRLQAVATDQRPSSARLEVYSAG